MSEESIRVIIRIRLELNDTPEENDPQNNCLDAHIDRNMIANTTHAEKSST